MDLDLIKEIIVIAIGSSVFSTAIIQKIKEQLKSKKCLFYISFLVSIATGICFSISFSNLSMINSIWVGLTTWVGADTIYKAFEEKIFTKFSDMNKEKETIIKIERDDI